MTDWQPISTAPRDGTEVDLWVIRDGHGERFASASWDVMLGRWFNGYLHPLHRDADPTHWMPLPPPPKDDSDD